MFFCTQCGKQNPDTAKFCTGCGVSISALQTFNKKEGFEQATSQSPQNGFFDKLRRREEKNSSVTIIIGIALIIISQTANFTKTRTYDTYDMDKSMGMQDAFNSHMLDTETTVDTKKKNLCLYGGLALLALGFYFSSRKSLG
jgi:uncharacterized membrane protein YvbJ